METQTIVVSVLVVLLNGGALLSFWAWVRSSISTNAATVAKVEAEVAAIKATCAERLRWLEDVNKAIHAMARNVVRLGQASGVDVESPE